jgi:hypothetical protein
MSIPPLEHPCWTRLATGAVTRFETQHLSLQLLFSRLRLETYSTQKKAADVHAYFVKYERYLASEIAQLSRL